MAEENKSYWDKLWEELSVKKVASGIAYVLGAGCLASVVWLWKYAPAAGKTVLKFLTEDRLLPTWVFILGFIVVVAAVGWALFERALRRAIARERDSLTVSDQIGPFVPFENSGRDVVVMGDDGIARSVPSDEIGLVPPGKTLAQKREEAEAAKKFQEEQRAKRAEILKNTINPQNQPQPTHRTPLPIEDSGLNKTLKRFEKERERFG